MKLGRWRSRTNLTFGTTDLHHPSVTNTIKDTIKLILLLVTSLNCYKILWSLGIENIGVDCVFRELGLVSWILIWMLIYINIPHWPEASAVHNKCRTPRWWTIWVLSRSCRCSLAPRGKWSCAWFAGRPGTSWRARSDCSAAWAPRGSWGGETFCGHAARNMGICQSRWLDSERKKNNKCNE